MAPSLLGSISESSLLLVVGLNRLVSFLYTYPGRPPFATKEAMPFLNAIIEPDDFTESGKLFQLRTTRTENAFFLISVLTLGNFKLFIPAASLVLLFCRSSMRSKNLFSLILP
jgi:hypothetical protein